jgi:hypothetical protein
MINRGIKKKRGEKSAQGPLLHHESYMKSLGTEPPGLRVTASVLWALQIGYLDHSLQTNMDTTYGHAMAQAVSFEW